MEKNFLKLPQKIIDDVESCESEFLVVACSKRIDIEDISKGVYAHIGLVADGEDLIFADAHHPSSANGRYSKRNIEGWEVVRKDLPKITKTFYWESPNFGDASTYGTHMHYQDREVYQREYHEPRLHSLMIEIIKSPVGEGGTYHVKFQIDDVFDKDSEGALDRIFFALNLLQENTGASGVFRSDISDEDFLKMTNLSWEIFPEGTADIIMEKIMQGSKPPSPEKQEKMRDRIEMFNSLKAKNIMFGSGGFGAYIGAEFADDLVVFENVNYGNALYILYENWQDTSQKSRIDLLSGTDEKYYRIIHTEGWEKRFIRQMKDELQSRAFEHPINEDFFSKGKFAHTDSQRI